MAVNALRYRHGRSEAPQSDEHPSGSPHGERVAEAARKTYPHSDDEPERRGTKLPRYVDADGRPELGVPWDGAARSGRTLPMGRIAIAQDPQGAAVALYAGDLAP